MFDYDNQKLGREKGAGKWSWVWPASSGPNRYCQVEPGSGRLYQNLLGAIVWPESLSTDVLLGPLLLELGCH